MPSVSIRPPEKADAGTWAYIGTVAGMTEAEVKDIGSNKTRAEQYFRQVSGRDDVRFGEWAYLTAYR